LQALIVAWPAAHQLFRTAALTPREVALIAALGVAPVAAILLAERARKRA
jgi:hypothetical protein